MVNKARTVLLMILFMVALPSCNYERRAASVNATENTNTESRPQLALSSAIEKVFAEIASNYGDEFESSEIEITAQRSMDSWVIRLVFLPKTPGEEFLATVNDEGLVEVGPGW